MILEKSISMIFPSRELGRKVASEDSRTQCQVFEGFAAKQLLDGTYNNQTIEGLVVHLPSETVLWFIKVYQEIVKQEKLPKSAVKYNELLVEEALKDIKGRQK